MKTIKKLLRWRRWLRRWIRRWIEPGPQTQTRRYFDGQSESSGFIWPTDTWLQKRIKFVRR